MTKIRLALMSTRQFLGGHEAQALQWIYILFHLSCNTLLMDVERMSVPRPATPPTETGVGKRDIIGIHTERKFRRASAST